MARTAPRARPDREQVLETVHAHCPACGGRLRYRYDNRHTVSTLAGLVRLRLRIRSRDVSLALSRPADASFLNVLEGVVVELGQPQGAGVDVAVALGHNRIVARITRKSVDKLGLAPGKRVYALVKSVAIDRHSVGYA